MKAPEIFALAIRLAGLWLVVLKVPDLASDVIRMFEALADVKILSFLEQLAFFIWAYTAMWWLLTGAPLLQRLAFPGSMGGYPKHPRGD